MTAYKRNYDDALMTLRDYVRFGVKTQEEITAAENEARRLGKAYWLHTTRYVDIEDDISEYKDMGRNLRRFDHGFWSRSAA